MHIPTTESLAGCSDSKLLANLRGLVAYNNRLLVRLLDYLNEVEARRLYASQGCSSMFVFCTSELGFSEGSTNRRLTAARLMKRHPILRARIESGELHLCTLLRIAKYLTYDNVAHVVATVCGKPNRFIDAYLLELDPHGAKARASVPSQMRPLPNLPHQPSAPTPVTPLLDLASPDRHVAPCAHPSADSPSTTHDPASLVSHSVNEPPRESASAPLKRTPSSLRVADGAPPASPSSPRPPDPALRLPALDVSSSEGKGGTDVLRYGVEFTASRELRDKLERLKALMAHQNPTGDLAPIIERAADLLLAKIEKERFGLTTPRRSTGGGHVARTASRDPGYIPNETKRAVVARDGWQCAYVGENGKRCTERRFLQFDHLTPRALGGTGGTSNVRIACAAHNRHAAEKVFGRSHIESRIERRRQKRLATTTSSKKPAPRSPDSPPNQPHQPGPTRNVPSHAPLVDPDNVS